MKVAEKQIAINRLHIYYPPPPYPEQTKFWRVEADYRKDGCHPCYMVPDVTGTLGEKDIKKWFEQQSPFAGVLKVKNITLCTREEVIWGVKREL